MDPVGAAEPSAPPGPLTHLNLRDPPEARPRSAADGRSPAGGWSRASPEHTTVLREGVRRCLQQQCEQTVRILHAKVAQKSYGNEKRFFCPPPCVYLAGPGWRVKPVPGQAHLAGDTGPTVCGYMGLDGASGSAAETQKLNFEEQPDSREFGCAKTLYISDADKRKHFRLVLRLVLRGGRELGTFHSRLIKVISKPSQKKQSLKNTDLCISSGSKVSLFNRLRSQTVSTRYLSVEDGAFVASARQWAAFTLHLADDHSSQGDFPPREGYIRYGSLVRLVCTVTGITLPPMIIRKVAKQCALLDVDEPISQLHKCALQFPGGPPGGGGTYLCLATEKVVQFQAPRRWSSPSAPAWRAPGSPSPRCPSSAPWSSAAGETWPLWSSTGRTSTRGSRCGSGTWRRKPCTGARGPWCAWCPWWPPLAAPGAGCARPSPWP
ncbi:recombining binding protein suppressor of hairless-like protein isoform X3 [Pipistrellus kuhlii]|uniref:recombining binding protein suppressor of hairless-like protein isoform X3 n=1 Tax=Pipistrellus kuhlii TaxID=59472 RepID=UPI00174F0F1A|nr:recombining binding protein suppressor of hairless-like protein isoform X3 [Pipistrellus kuhlii]